MTKPGYDEEVARHPHDGLVKRIFTRPEAAAAELRQALSPALTTRLDWSTLRVEPGTFVDGELKPKHSDILYSVDLEGTTHRAFVFVLMEHQSTPDRMMAVRFLGYANRIYERFLAENKGAETIPLVVPLLLFQGPNGWTMPRRLSDLLDVPTDLRGAFRPPIELVFGVDDLGQSVIGEHVTREQLARDRGLALAEAARTLLWLVHHGERVAGDRAGQLELYFDIVGDTWGNEELLAIATYVLSAFEPETPLRGILAESARKETRQMYTTMLDELLAKGEAKGRIKGRAKGIAEMVERLLDNRGLALTEELRARLADCEDQALLQRWFDRAVTAATLDEVFGD
ncbi:MAG: Rpn family recombination-promoting nuclease/putative transposase [Myxococcota bacterium]